MDSKRLKAGFWRRLAATWVDLFFIYCFTVFLLAVSDILRIRIAFEPLYFSLAALYGTVSLALKGQTIGKTILGITVTFKADGKLSLRAAIVREALGKWGIVVAVPVILGRLIVGRAWVATVYDMLIVVPVLIVMVIYLMVAKRTWYDQLAGTSVKRIQAPAKLTKGVILTLIGATILGLGTKVVEYKAKDNLPCRLSLHRSMRSVEPYKSFLKQEHAKPVDYVISLFDRYDLVVLCERLHPETTQWDFIYDLVSDQRFIDRVGHVFTEYGQVGMQDYLDSFLATDSLDAAGIDERVIHIMRNFAVWPTWTNTNFYTYLKRFYKFNQTLPPEMQIRHHFTDSSIDWSKIRTAEEYQAYFRTTVHRDEQMAQSIIREMNHLADLESKRQKGLVIMNYRHAFNFTGGVFAFDNDGLEAKAKLRNTYEYLKESFGNRTANVLLNTGIVVFAPVAGGLWDAAFVETGNKTAGFDFENSPFGNDPFDLFPFSPGIKGQLNYRDVFTGYVQVHPLEKQCLQEGIPGYFKGFEEEALRRAALVNDDYLQATENGIAQDKNGHLPEKRELPNVEIETLIELFILALNGVGVIIALAAIVMRGRSGGGSGYK